MPKHWRYCCRMCGEIFTRGESHAGDCPNCRSSDLEQVSSTVGLGRKWRWANVLAERLSDAGDDLLASEYLADVTERQLQLFETSA